MQGKQQIDPKPDLFTTSCGALSEAVDMKNGSMGQKLSHSWLNPENWIVLEHL